MIREAFRDAIENNFAKRFPFVLFAQPGSSSLQAILQTSGDNYSFNFGDRGVIFFPFSSELTALFIPEEFSAWFSSEITETTSMQDIVSFPKEKSSEQRHLELVKSGIERINSTHLEKVVLSRQQIVPLRRFNLIELADALFSQDKRAFRYMWFHPESGLWCGATPERLISVEGHRFSTMSLAGTRSSESNENTEWTAKEFYEQSVVTETIVNGLTPFSESLDVSEVKTVQAGNLEHLRTDISGVLKPQYNWWDLARELHPTPAVCGAPGFEALEFIQQNEGYDRSFYTGFIGPVSGETDKTDLFVNLRCMRIEDHSAVLYTGGGITSDSSPDDEWLETCRKQIPMLKLLHPFL